MSFEIQFTLNDELIYFINYAQRKRLCLSKNFEKEIFEQTYNNNYHASFSRTYETITTNFYFRKLIKQLKRYIAYCRQYNMCQIKRHQSYNSLNSIISFLVLFYIVSFDFILALSSMQNIDFAMFVICKFLKKIIILLEKTIYIAKN